MNYRTYFISQGTDLYDINFAVSPNKYVWVKL